MIVLGSDSFVRHFITPGKVAMHPDEEISDHDAALIGGGHTRGVVRGTPL